MHEMKNSGIEWIGEFPSEWQIVKLKYLANILRGGSPRPIDAFLTDDPNGFNWIKIGDTIKGNKFINSTKQKIVSEGVKKSRVVHKGDLILTNSMSFGEPYILNIDGCIHDGWVSFSNIKNVSTNFLYYFLSSPFCLLQFKRQVDGGVVQNLNVEKIGSTIVLLPSFIQQERIADFLDKKCAEIDAVIEKTKATIEEYKKLKQSVITQAVTKGIRPNRPMKDSGIEWIGEIPADWDLRAIKTSFSVYAGATPKSEVPEFWDGDIRWITPADYKTEDKFVESGRRRITLQGYNSCGTNLVPAGSIVFSKRAPIGSVAICNTELCTNQGCLSCVPKHRLNIDFFYFILSVLTEIFNLFGSGTTFKEISYDSFVNFRLPYPTLEEQNEIADYLDKKCSEIDELIAKKTSLLSELESYKKSLIYEYVTGKKEVTQ